LIQTNYAARLCNLFFCAKNEWCSQKSKKK